MISVNLNKAKAIAHDMRRDIKATIPSEAAAAEAARAVIRAKYAGIQTDMDAAVDVVELKSIVEAALA